MKENNKTIQSGKSGLELLTSLIEGRIPAPPMANTIPMTIISASSGSVRFTAWAGNQHLNPMGGVHGGFAATVLDTVTACAVHSMLEPGISYVTTDLSIKMVKPVPKEQTLTATGKLLHISGRLAVSEGMLKDDAGTLLAHATATCMILKDKNRTKTDH